MGREQGIEAVNPFDYVSNYPEADAWAFGHSSSAMEYREENK